MGGGSLIRYLGKEDCSCLFDSVSVLFTEGVTQRSRTAPIPLLAPVTRTVFPMSLVALKMDIT